MTERTEATMKTKAFTVGRGALIVSICTLLLLLGLSPVVHGVQVRGPFTRVYDVTPGEARDVFITVHNGGTRAERVRLYLTDYVHDTGRGWIFPPAGTLPRSNAHWIRGADVEFVLQPGEEREVALQISVPTDETIRGTYWGSVMVEPQSLRDVLLVGDETEDTSARITLRQGFRYQIALITNVGDSGQRIVSFQHPTLTYTSEGHVMFEVDIENIGERWLHPHITLDVYDGTGALIRRVAGGRPHLLPDTSRTVQFPLDNLSPGTYVALLFVDEGSGDVFATRMTFNVNNVTNGSTDSDGGKGENEH